MSKDREPYRVMERLWSLYTDERRATHENEKGTRNGLYLYLDSH